MNNEYKDEDIYIVQYPDGKELCFTQGQIQLIDNYNIKHSVSTHHVSSVSSILIQRNDKFKNIVINKQGNKNGKKLFRKFYEKYFK